MKPTILNIILVLFLLTSVIGNIYSLYQLHKQSAEIATLKQKLEVYNVAYSTDQNYKEKMVELDKREADLKLKEKSYEKSLENIGRRGRVEDNRIKYLPAIELVRELSDFNKSMGDSAYRSRFLRDNPDRSYQEQPTGG